MTSESFRNFKYEISNSGFVTLKVFDLIGKEIATLVKSYQKPGLYNIKFDAADLKSGIYIYNISYDNFIKYRKMMLMK